MGRATAAPLARRLIAERLPPHTPAVCVSDVSEPAQRVVHTSIGDLAAGFDLSAVPSPMMLMIGDVFAARY
jgi:siroheme synthase